MNEVDGAFEYGYDTVDRMELVVYPSASRLRTCYDGAGAVQSVARENSANAVQQTHATNGVYGADGALHEVWNYTASRRLNEITATHFSGSQQRWKQTNYYCKTSLTAEGAATKDAL